MKTRGLTTVPHKFTLFFQTKISVFHTGYPKRKELPGRKTADSTLLSMLLQQTGNVLKKIFEQKTKSLLKQ